MASAAKKVSAYRGVRGRLPTDTPGFICPPDTPPEDDDGPPIVVLKSPPKLKGPTRKGWSEEKCRSVLVLKCAKYPRNYNYYDGVHRVTDILGDHFGKDNLDLALGVLYEFIEVGDVIFTWEESAAYRRWAFDHRQRHNNWLCAHTPRLGDFVIGPIQPTKRLRRWRNLQNGVVEEEDAPSPPATPTVSRTRGISNREEWKIDHTTYKTDTGITEVFYCPTPGELNAVFFEEQVARGEREAAFPDAVPKPQPALIAPERTSGQDPLATVRSLPGSHAGRSGVDNHNEPTHTSAGEDQIGAALPRMPEPAVLRPISNSIKNTSEEVSLSTASPRASVKPSAIQRIKSPILDRIATLWPTSTNNTPEGIRSGMPSPRSSVKPSIIKRILSPTHGGTEKRSLDEQTVSTQPEKTTLSALESYELAEKTKRYTKSLPVHSIEDIINHYVKADPTPGQAKTEPQINGLFCRKNNVITDHNKIPINKVVVLSETADELYMRNAVTEFGYQNWQVSKGKTRRQVDWEGLKTGPFTAELFKDGPLDYDWEVSPSEGDSEDVVGEIEEAIPPAPSRPLPKGPDGTPVYIPQLRYRNQEPSPAAPSPSVKDQDVKGQEAMPTAALSDSTGNQDVPPSAPSPFTRDVDLVSPVTSSRSPKKPSLRVFPSPFTRDPNPSSSTTVSRSTRSRAGSSAAPSARVHELVSPPTSAGSSKGRDLISTEPPRLIREWPVDPLVLVPEFPLHAKDPNYMFHGGRTDSYEMTPLPPRCATASSSYGGDEDLGALSPPSSQSAKCKGVASPHPWQTPRDREVRPTPPPSRKGKEIASPTPRRSARSRGMSTSRSSEDEIPLVPRIPARFQDIDLFSLKPQTQSELEAEVLTPPPHRESWIQAMLAKGKSDKEKDKVEDAVAARPYRRMTAKDVTARGTSDKENTRPGTSQFAKNRDAPAPGPSRLPRPRDPTTAATTRSKGARRPTATTLPWYAKERDAPLPPRDPARKTVTSSGQLPRSAKGKEVVPPVSSSRSDKGKEVVPPATSSRSAKGKEVAPSTTSRLPKAKEVVSPMQETQSLEGQAAALPKGYLRRSMASMMSMISLKDLLLPKTYQIEDDVDPLIAGPSRRHDRSPQREYDDYPHMAGPSRYGSPQPEDDDYPYMAGPSRPAHGRGSETFQASDIPLALLSTKRDKGKGPANRRHDFAMVDEGADYPNKWTKTNERTARDSDFVSPYLSRSIEPYPASPPSPWYPPWQDDDSISQFPTPPTHLSMQKTPTRMQAQNIVPSSLPQPVRRRDERSYTPSQRLRGQSPGSPTPTAPPAAQPGSIRDLLSPSNQRVLAKDPKTEEDWYPPHRR